MVHQTCGPNNLDPTTKPQPVCAEFLGRDGFCGVALKLWTYLDRRLLGCLRQDEVARAALRHLILAALAWSPEARCCLVVSSSRAVAEQWDGFSMIQRWQGAEDTPEPFRQCGRGEVRCCGVMQEHPVESSVIGLMYLDVLLD